MLRDESTIFCLSGLFCRVVTRRQRLQHYPVPVAGRAWEVVAQWSVCLDGPGREICSGEVARPSGIEQIVLFFCRPEFC